MYIVQVRGANGSGKTTIVKQLLALSNDKELLVWDMGGGKEKIFATVCNDIGWAAIGNYPSDKPMGGCDNFKSMDDVKQAIHDTFIHCPNLYGIVFEGMMITAVKTPFYNFLMEMQETFHIKPLFVNLQADIETCLTNIAARGTRRSASKPINLKLLASKIDATERYGDWFGEYSRWIDVSKIPKDKMVKAFLMAVGDNTLWTQI